MTKRKELFYQVISLHISIAKESYEKFSIILNMSLYNYPIKESLRIIYEDFMPIEVLPREEKKGYWDEINRLFPNKTKEEKIELCRNMYIIGNLF